MKSIMDLFKERSFIMKIKKHKKSKAIEKEMDFEFDEADPS